MSVAVIGRAASGEAASAAADATASIESLVMTKA
jgi:hypothetical protein